jgi:hypothetical protein
VRTAAVLTWPCPGAAAGGAPRSTQAAGRPAAPAGHQALHAATQPGPADALRDRRQDELPERAAGVDDAGGHAALLGRDQPRGGGHQHRRAGHAGAARRQHADGEDQAGGGGHQRDQAVPSATRHTGAGQQHAPGADPVGHHAGKRLRQAPPQLAERQTPG